MCCLIKFPLFLILKCFFYLIKNKSGKIKNKKKQENKNIIIAPSQDKCDCIKQLSAVA